MCTMYINIYYVYNVYKYIYVGIIYINLKLYIYIDI